MSNAAITLIVLAGVTVYLAAGVAFVRIADRWCHKQDKWWDEYDDNKLGRGILAIFWLPVAFSLGTIRILEIVAEAIGGLTISKKSREEK